MKVIDASGRYIDVQASSSTFITGGDPSPSGGIVELIGGSDGSVRRAGYMQVYRANPYLWACVQLFARSIARFPIKLYEPLEEGGSNRIRPTDRSMAGSLARVLRRPGHRRSAASLRHATVVDRFVHGNAVWFPDRDAAGWFTGMRRVPWRHVQVEEIAGVTRYWDERKPAAKRLADDVIHFGIGLDCDELLNPSPIGSLHATLALYDAVEQHLVAYFRNAARPSGHLEVDRQTGKTAREAIREELQKLYSGPANAGKVMVTSGKWSPITEAPANTAVVDLAKQSREEICAAYGCPPPLIGILDRAIMSNVRELRSHTARDVTGPHVALFEGDLEAQVLDGEPQLENLVVEFEMAAVLRPDLEARAETWKNQRYVRSLNEIRETEGLPRIDHPDADMPWMPLNEAPLGADNSPHDPQPDPGSDGGPEEES